MMYKDLRHMRQQAGLSVSEAARLVNIADRSWQRYESGKKPMPLELMQMFMARSGLHNNDAGKV
jgi:predicted transcriptional regulator